MKTIWKLCLAGIAVLALGMAAAACGGGSSSTIGATTAGGGTEGAAVTAGEEGEAAQGGSSAAMEAAIAPYLGHPSAFPVTEKLKQVPKGAHFVYADCGSPVCGLLWELLQPAAQTMGVKLERVKAGSAANTVATAFDTIVAQQPDGVIVPGINVELWSKQAKELQARGVPIVTFGVTGTEPYGIKSPWSAENYAHLVGKLLANYVVAKMNPEAQAAIYVVPELPFSPIIGESFTAELESICDKCSARTVEIPIATIGNTAPNTIVSDLQTNPETDVAVFSTDTIETGLPTALHAAGIDVETLGAVPGPDNLQYLKEGKETAALGFDLPVAAWSMMDQLAREIGGQELKGGEAEGITDLQFLTQKDITFDPSKGWTGYPEFAERFAGLWGVEGS